MGADEKVGTKCGGNSAGTCVTRDTSIDDHQVTSREDDSDMQPRSNWHELLEVLSGFSLCVAPPGACWGRAQRTAHEAWAGVHETLARSRVWSPVSERSGLH